MVPDVVLARGQHLTFSRSTLGPSQMHLLTWTMADAKKNGDGCSIVSTEQFQKHILFFTETVDVDPKRNTPKNHRESFQTYPQNASMQI